MLLSMDDLSRFTAQAEDATFPVKDIFFTAPSGDLAYLLVDTAGWFDTDTVLISAQLIRALSPDDRTVTLDTDEARIRNAPKWRDETSTIPDALPPIVVGPFGNTISPLMLGVLARAQGQNPSAGQALTHGLDRFSDLKGVDAFGADGELGRVVDLLLAPDTRKIAYAVIDTGTVLPGRQLIVPIEKLRHQAEQETHLVFDLTSDDLAGAPQMEQADRLDRNWLDAVRSYYQLPV